MTNNEVEQPLLLDLVGRSRLDRKERRGLLPEQNVRRNKMSALIGLFLVLLAALIACSSSSPPDVQPSATAPVPATSPSNTPEATFENVESRARCIDQASDAYVDGAFGSYHRWENLGRLG